MAKDSTEPDQTPTTSAKPAAPKAAPASGTAASSVKKGTKPKSDRRKPVRLDSPRWLAPVMVACFVIGLVWIVAYYIAPEAPFISTLGWWNVVVGFGFFTVGFVLSTKWK